MRISASVETPLSTNSDPPMFEFFAKRISVFNRSPMNTARDLSKLYLASIAVSLMSVYGFLVLYISGFGLPSAFPVRPVAKDSGAEQAPAPGKKVPECG